MLSTILNSEKEKVPDIYVIVILLLLISHRTFISPGDTTLLDTDIIFCLYFNAFLDLARRMRTLRGRFHYESHHIIAYFILHRFLYYFGL